MNIISKTKLYLPMYIIKKNVYQTYTKPRYNLTEKYIDHYSIHYNLNSKIHSHLFFIYRNPCGEIVQF